MVECDLAKVEVAGSNPVSRFERDEGGGMRDERKPLFFIPHTSALIALFGGVAKW